MVDAASHRHHAIDYIEITVQDVAIGKRFYGAAFGWDFNDYGPDYAGIQGPEHEMGGLCRGESGGVGEGPLVILFSTDLDATLRSVTEAGGRIVTPPFSFPGGRRFHFADPSGNVLAVWSPTPDEPV